MVFTLGLRHTFLGWSRGLAFRAVSSVVGHRSTQMTMAQLDWPPDCDVTLDAIRSLHTPAGHYRISLGLFPAGTSFPGRSRAGRVYVLSGVCCYTFGNSTVQLSAPSYFDHPEGGYSFAVDGDDDVSLVHVWLLPPEFRCDNS